jgi:hypothetical protein
MEESILDQVALLRCQMVGEKPFAAAATSR